MLARNAFSAFQIAIAAIEETHQHVSENRAFFVPDRLINILSLRVELTRFAVAIRRPSQSSNGNACLRLKSCCHGFVRQSQQTRGKVPRLRQIAANFK